MHMFPNIDVNVEDQFLTTRQLSYLTSLAEKTDGVLKKVSKVCKKRFERWNINISILDELWQTIKGATSLLSFMGSYSFADSGQRILFIASDIFVPSISPLGIKVQLVYNHSWGSYPFADSGQRGLFIARDIVIYPLRWGIKRQLDYH